MLKKILLCFFIILLIPHQGCQVNVDNSITITSQATENVYVNILGSNITIAPGQTQVIKEIQQGTYAYQTAYDVPSNVSSATSSGAVSGTFVMNAQTKVYLFYTSSVQVSGVLETYMLNATISSNDEVTTTSSSSSSTTTNNNGNITGP
jgi:hypothetical protein